MSADLVIGLCIGVAVVAATWAVESIRAAHARERLRAEVDRAYRAGGDDALREAATDLAPVDRQLADWLLARAEAPVPPADTSEADEDGS